MVVSARSAIVFFSIFLNLYLTAQEEKAEENPYKRLSKSFIGAVKRGQHFKNTRFFDSSFYGKMAEAAADKKVESFVKDYGQIVAIEKTEVDTQGCKMAVCTAVKSAKGKYLWYHYFDQGQYIQRFEIDTFQKQYFYQAEPLENKNFTRREVLVETNAFIKLPGSLYLPNGSKKCPLVVIVHGSGPHDRNGSIIRNKVYLDMALGLVQKGIAVLIYDKRTYVYQWRDPFPVDSMDYNSETVDDAVAAFYLAKRIKEIDSNKVFVAGHSQGAMCGPLIAKRCKGLKGLILLAAPGRSLLEIMPEQLDYVLGLQKTNKEEAETMVKALKWQMENAKKPDLNLKSKVMLPFGTKPKYWLMDRNYKVLEEGKTLTLPILLVQGGRDYNVTKTDYDLWVNAMQGKNNFQPVWYENLDHMFFEGTGKAKPDDISKAQHVSKSVVNKMTEFLNSK
jgi:hypothetical protein